MSEALTWDDLADIYFQETGQQARTKPINKIFEWAKNQPDKFFICQDEGTLHLKEVK